MLATSDIVLNALVSLEDQLVSLRHHAYELQATYGTGDKASARTALAGVNDALASLRGTLWELRVHVLAFDQQEMGSCCGSVGELVIRGARFVVFDRMDLIANELQAEVHRLTPVLAVRETISQYRRCRMFVHEELGRINDTWMRYRPLHVRAQPAADQSFIGQERMAPYARAIQEASHAVAAIADAPDVARFLRRGTCCGLPEVQAACLQVAVALRMVPDAELGTAYSSRIPAESFHATSGRTCR